MKDPNIVNVVDVVNNAKTNFAGLPDGRFVPARSVGYSSWRYRLRATWLVFTGRADALVWPGQ